MNTFFQTPLAKVLFILVSGTLLGVGLTIVMDYLDSRSEVSQASLEQAQEPMIDYTQALEKLRTQFGLSDDDPAIVVSLTEQRLFLVKNNEVVKSYPISGSAYGAGSRAGSNKTPLGTHKVSEKFGNGAKTGTVFRARGQTTEIARIYTDSTDLDEDLVTTRILWLDGLEPGINKGKGVDSHSRFIYIHGTPEEGLIGRPASHGCIRMINHDVIELFDSVPVGTLVEILE